MDPEGILTVRRSVGTPGSGFREERLPFGDLQQLIDLCAVHAEGAAFVQVQVVGRSAGRQHRLVLDFGHFGHFGREPEP
jgi:hypothetical protein